jgi:hypothetical protein
METPKTKYNVKTVDFLIASDTIIDSAIANQTFLETKRATWNMAFFQDIKIQINQAVQTHLGLDSAKQLREASQIVYTIVANSLVELAEVKVQIEEDFKDTPSQKIEILNTLGYTNYFFNARKGDQEALINLLFQFKTNLTQELNNQIVAKGTAQTTLDAVISKADALKDADVLQEGKKGTRKELTATAINEFNNIYDKIISITRISNKFFKSDKAKSDQFSFSKVAKNINKTKTPKK